MNTSPATHYRIGAAAREAGVGVDTIRYYEREGLLPEPRRRPSGYRDYDAGPIGQLRFIRRAKELGFSLDDIRELLALSTDRNRGVAGVKARAEDAAGRCRTAHPRTQAHAARIEAVDRRLSGPR